MSEISNYEAQKKKLQGLCDEHNFTFRFFKDRYPITLVITPINDIATQMDMLGNVEETGYCSQDSSMCWYFENSELKTKVKGTFSIDKVLRTKIENILLKMISFWQQFFFRDLMENGKLRNFGVPVPDVPDSNSQRDSQQDAPQDDPDDEPSEDSAEDDTEEESMAKAAVTRSIRDNHQKNFLKIFNGLTGKHSRWEIWEDFVTLTAIEISNSTDKVNATERTKMYQTIISKYSAKERDGMAEMLAEVVMGMEQNPDQDFLGSLYMMCELGNDHAGQFFTPYDVCRCMAEITFDPKLHPDMEGFISVSDPACGAGATLLAFLNVCKRRNICYHNKVLVIAQDIDFIVGLMCYIQCSFMGCAGYVVIGDTLVNPATAYDSRGLLPAGPQNRIWYMPLFSTDVWYMRRQIAQMNLLFEPKGEPAKIEKTDIKPANLQKSIKNEPKAPENEPLNETKTGQLTFF